MKRLPVVLTEDEFVLVMRKTVLQRHKLAFLLGFYDCMRVSEIVSLKREHVDSGQRIIRVVQGKGGKDRNIPIAPQVWKVLRRTKLPLGIGVRALQRAFKRALKASGVTKDAHFHTLRHSGATFYLNNGWNIRMVQQLLGHSRLDTTAIYTHISPNDMVKKMWEEKTR